QSNLLRTAHRSEVHAMIAIGLDVGGTKIAAGVVRDDGSVVERLPPVETPSGDKHALIDELLRMINLLRIRHPAVVAVGIGAAGLVDWPTGFIRYAPNSTYHALPLKEM